MKLRKFGSGLLTLLVATSMLAACGNNTRTSSTQQEETSEATTKEVDEEASKESNNSSNESTTTVTYPITIKHAFGETVIEEKPENIVTISWGNQDVALALGVVPVGVSEANYGVAEGEKLLPWTKEAFDKLGEQNPVLFADSDGLDFEAISDAQPDVILAAYSGVTQEEYDLLSQIAPVVAYPTVAWQTYWRDQIILDATGMGMKTEGEELVAELEALITEKVTAYPQIAGKSAAFFYFSPTDLGKFYVYLPTDPRAAYLEDLGMVVPESVKAMMEGAGSFALELSAENADVLKDVDIIVAYGNEELLKAMQADELIGSIPAVQRGSVALIEDNSALAAAATPSALSIPATIDEFLSIYKEAADKVQ